MNKTRVASIGLAVLDVALFALGLELVPYSNMGFHGDSRVRYDMLNELLSAGTLPNHGYSMIGPLFATPLWYLKNEPAAKAELVLNFNLWLFALACIVLLVVLRNTLRAATARAFALLLFFATAFPHQLQDFNNEVFSSALLGCGTLGIVFGRPFAKWTGAFAIMLATGNTPALAIGVGLCMLYHLVVDRRLRWLLVPLGAAALILGESWLRRGSPWNSGYENNAGYKTSLPYSGLPGFSYPLLLGVISILFSFGKGLAIFYPGLCLPVQRWISERALLRVFVMWLLVLAGLLVVYGRWWSWYGGWSWGPRFFLFAAFPASLALALWSEQAKSSWSAVAACLIIAWGFWTGFNGLVFSLDNLDICTQRNYRLESFCWYVPEFSPLIRPFVVPRELVEWEQTAVYVFVAAYLRVTAPLWWRCLRQTAAGTAQLRSTLLPRLREFRF